MLTLAGHGFYWFELQRPVEPTPDENEDWEGTAGSSAVADSLLAAGVVDAAEEIPGDSDTRTGADRPEASR
jgi:maltose alpha-D-glucosyltransferase/alpha-amylase